MFLFNDKIGQFFLLISFIMLLFVTEFAKADKHEPFDNAIKEIKDLYYNVNCVPMKLEKEKCGNYLFSLNSTSDTSFFIEKLKLNAIINYNTQFSNYNIDIDTYNNNNDLVEKLNNGGIDDLLKLYIINKNPYFFDFSFLHSKANKILLKAISLGSEKAIFELGYDRPYAIKTQVESGNIKAYILSNCDKFSRSDMNNNCFLYRISILNGELENYWTIFINDKYSDFQPDEISIVQWQSKDIIKLTSKNLNGSAQRIDYFSADGKFLGSSPKDSKIAYIYEYRNNTQTLDNLILNNFTNQKILVSKKVLKYPSYNMFMIQEKRREVFSKSLVNPSFMATEGFPNYIDLNLLSFRDVNIFSYQYYSKNYFIIDTEKIEKFKNEFGYNPLDMPNIISYTNFDTFLEMAYNADLMSITYLYDLYDNPLSFVHKEQYKEKLDLFLNSLHGFRNIEFYSNNLKLKEMLEDEDFQAFNQKGYILKYKTNPYISVTNHLFKDLNIEISMLCDSFSDIPESHFSIRQNCYALRMIISKNNISKSHFLILENNIYKKLIYESSHYRDRLLYYPVLSVCNSTLDFNKSATLVKINSWFAFANYYIDPDNINSLCTESNYIYSCIPDNINNNIHMPTNLHISDIGNCTNVHLSYFTNWEDVQLEIEEVSNE
jgi:hypothetical protein